MARSKHLDDRLTKAQEIFVQSLVKGYSQRQSYLKAYPNRIKWKENSLDSASSTLLRNVKVRKRYDELLQQVREEETKKTMWTREQSIEALRYVVEINRKDLERIDRAAEEELELLHQMMLEDPEEAASHIKEILKRKKAKRASMVNNKGITDAVAELNKMQGFNEETINLNGTVLFEGEEELED